MFLFLWEPDEKDVIKCKNISKNFDYNYDKKYVRATRLGFDGLKTTALHSDGFQIDRNQIKIGSGQKAYEKCKSFVRNWGHFQLGWAQVDPSTSLEEGNKVCVRSKTLFLWTLNPLEILYRDELEAQGTMNQTFSFAHGTLRGHMLAGEERFCVEMKADGSVWYEILTFSKPANFLSAGTYPISRFFQKKFARESMESVKKCCSDVPEE